MMDSRLTSKLSKTYYSPRGYWKGLTAIKHLVAATKVSEDVAKDWLKKQAIWQIYLPAPRHVPRPKFDVPVPNEVHQADLLFLPHDRLPRGQKTCKYALTVVDVASRSKEAEPLTSKSAAEVAYALWHLQTGASEVAQASSAWPRARVHGHGKQASGKAQGQGQARSSRCPPGPRNCRTLEPHLGWETIWASAGTRTADEPRWAVAGVGEKAPCGHCCPKWWGHPVDRKKACRCD